MEMLVIALAIIILFGPDKLPHIARDLGSGIRKMRGAMEDIKTEIMKEADQPVNEIKKEIAKVKEAAKDYNPITDINKEIDEVKLQMQAPIEAPHKNIPPAEDDNYQGPISR